MGLTIHYQFHARPRRIPDARRIVTRLHAAAADLPFDEVHPWQEFTADACSEPPDFPCGFFHADGSQVRRHSSRPQPIQSLIAFRVLPGPGCESAEFGLARYGRQQTWSWHAFCKTQYASDPRAGGAENFLRCHLSIVRLLDHARDLGLKTTVNDESGYWEYRDRTRLLAALAEYNELIAGLGGRFKDQFGEVTGPIFGYPNFEHLEARGNDPLRRKR